MRPARQFGEQARQRLLLLPLLLLLLLSASELQLPSSAAAEPFMYSPCGDNMQLTRDSLNKFNAVSCMRTPLRNFRNSPRRTSQRVHFR